MNTHSEHRPSIVLEMVHRPPSYGWFCLKCGQPWPCPFVGGGAA